VVDKILPPLELLLNDQQTYKCGISLLAYLGASLKQEASGFFQWIVQQLNKSAKPEAYLSVMSEYLDHLKQKADPLYVNNILSACQSFLDRIEKEDEINYVLDVLDKIASYHPAVMRTPFPDIVDMLVGIYLDPDTSNNIRERIESKKCKFEQN
jgi:hypothetical protein